MLMLSWLSVETFRRSFPFWEGAKLTWQAKFVSEPTTVSMLLLHYLSYVAALAAFVFVTLSLASGLLYISELIEEHSRLAKLVGQRAVYVIIVLQGILYFTDSLPLPQTIFSILCHVVYLQNFSSRWPLISLSSASFIASCTMAIVNHFLWFMYFSQLARDSRQKYRYRNPTPGAPGFTDISTFFAICVWLVPLFLFLSLSANDNALPTSGSGNSPTSSRPQHSKSSLFKSMFSGFSKDKKSRPAGLIIPSSASTSPSATYPLLSPSTPPLPSPFLSPPPRSPTVPSRASQQEVDPSYFPQRRLSRPSSEGFRGVASTSVSLPSRRAVNSGHNKLATE